MNVYGQLIKAQLENLAADISPASNGLVYYNTVSLFPKYYNGSWHTFADTDSTQVFTNKDYDGGVASNTSRITAPAATLATLQGLTRKAGSIWYASDTQSYYGDDGTNLSALGSGSGQGELNVIDNPSASTAITGWVASGAGITVARTTTLSDLPLSPVIDSAIKITPVSGTDYVRFRFTMPEALKNTKLKWEWYQIPLSGYVDGDLKAEMYKNSASNYGGTYTEFPLSTDVSGETFIPNAEGKYTTYFDADDADYYELRIVRVSGTTALNMANVIVGPGIQPASAVVTGWEPHTLVTGGMGTISNDKCIKQRVGSTLKMKGSFTVGVLDGSVAATIDLPTGLSVDISELSNTRETKLGTFKQLLSGTTDLSGSTYDGVLTWAVGNNGTLVLATQSSSNLYFGAVANAVLSSGATISFDIEVPIAEWAGGGTVNLAENGVEWASNYDASNGNDTTSFAYGPAGSAGIIGVQNLTSSARKRVRFKSPILPGDHLEIEILDRGRWLPMERIVPATNAGLDAAYSNIWQYGGTGANTVGIGLESVAGSDTDVDVVFGRFVHLISDGSGTGGEWGLITSSTAWRVKKVSANEALGFQEATSSSTGLAGPSGTWTPGDQGSTNVDGITNLKGYYSKVGKIVSCTVTADIDATAALFTSAVIDVPIPANFTGTDQAIGVGANIFDKNVGNVVSVNGTNNVALQYTAVVLTATTWTWSFQYEIQ